MDKPNASLSADRRGTLSIPDVVSFIVTDQSMVSNPSKSQNSRKKKGKKGDVSDDEVTVPVNTGSRTRPGKQKVFTDYEMDGTVTKKEENKTPLD